MKLNQLEYTLPKRHIAHSPANPRDHSKLMVIEKESGKISHHHFYDLPKLLTETDCLIFNESKVFPARLIGGKQNGGKIEILLVRKISAENAWEAMRKGKVSLGQTLVFGKLAATVIQIKENVINIQFSCRENELFSYMKDYGQTPIPPYINNIEDELEIRSKYQTIYANNVGSVAAPTAGLHFTDSVISELKKKNIQMEYVTLHVGLGTFLPIKTDDLTKHDMHEEYFTIAKDTLDRINDAKKQGKRIVAVGTTTVRVLETLTNAQGLLEDKGEHSTKIFIYPPYKFNFVDKLLTNFHLPHSTLLALVSAFVSQPNTKEEFIDFSSSLMGKAYKQAIENDYRFFSFGDSSLII